MLNPKISTPLTSCRQRSLLSKSPQWPDAMSWTSGFRINGISKVCSTVCLVWSLAVFLFLVLSTMYVTHRVLGDHLPMWLAPYHCYLNSTVGVSIKLLPVILANRQIIIADHTSEHSLDLPFNTLLKYTFKQNRPGMGGIVTGQSNQGANSVPSDHQHLNGYC